MVEAHAWLRGVTVRYGATTVLDGIDFAVAPGEHVALVGPNGSGKTTLLRTLAGTLKPQAGERLAPRGAYMPQDEHWEFPFALEDVVLTGRYASTSSLFSYAAADRAAVEAALRRVGLWDMRARPVTTVSGGERRRALLARTIAQGSELLLLDEPTTALDLEHRQAILRVLQESPAAVVFATHDLDAAAACAQRLVVLARGRIVADGPPRAVLTDQLLRDVFAVDGTVLERDGRLHVVTRL